MKKYFILLAFAFCAFTTQAQLPFSVDHDTLMLCDADPNTFELILDNHITNLTNGKLDLIWTRITNDIDPNMGSSICIRDLCYPSTTSTFTFNLTAGETAIVSCHLFNGMALPPNGLVQVRIEVAGDPNSFVILTFIFKEGSVNTDAVTAAKARFFPNPTTEYFQLEEADWVQSILVIDAKGSLVKQFSASPNQQYHVADLPIGSYFATLVDDSGVAVRSVRFEKQ